MLNFIQTKTEMILNTGISLFRYQLFLQQQQLFYLIDIMFLLYLRLDIGLSIYIFCSDGNCKSSMYCHFVILSAVC